MNTLIRIVIAVIIGAIVAWIAGIFLPQKLADLIGVVVGLIYFAEHDHIATRLR